MRDEKELTRRYGNQELQRRYEAGETDFTGIELINTYLYGGCLIDINLSRANWENANLQRAILIHANLSHANL